MIDSDLASVKEAVAELRLKIEERMRECGEKVQRIRQRAEADERQENNRAYLEIEPLRRQMKAMILSVAQYERLQMPPPMIMRR